MTLELQQMLQRTSPSEPPEPVEQEYPELGEHLRLIANGQHPVVKTLVVDSDAFYFLTHDKRRVVRRREQLKQPGRNEPCSCGSAKKYKKCCGV